MAITVVNNFGQAIKFYLIDKDHNVLPSGSETTLGSGLSTTLRVGNSPVPPYRLSGIETGNDIILKDESKTFGNGTIVTVVQGVSLYMSD